MNICVGLPQSIRTTVSSFVLLLLSGLPTLAAANYPSPDAAGFHHCALIYDRSQRTSVDLAHYVSRTRNGETEWLFDSFLFLIQVSDRGIRTENGETQKPDWEYHLNRWFASGRDLRALDAAIAAAGSPPTKRKIMLSIPYIHPSVTNFGDVDGDGRSENLATPEGRRTVVQWYLDEAQRRFQAAGFKHLELWGFYWMAEGISPSDEEVVRMAAQEVHSDGLRLLWIPYQNATGWNRWAACNIDVAILQPNYAFNTWQHGGNVGRNRLNLTAENARQNGMGVEIECWDIEVNPASRRPFMHYLADGAATRLGYQQAATAYYLGTDHVERIATSSDLNAQRMYTALGDYVTGRTVPDPDRSIQWTWSRGPSGTQVAEADVPRPGSISVVDVFLDEPAEGWRGVIEVFVLPLNRKDWVPAGWLVRSGKDASAGRYQWSPVPTGCWADRVRVTFRGRAGSAPLQVRRITFDPNGVVRPTASMALYRPYTVSPGVQAQYGDSGRELTDGIVPTTGYASGQTVGWNGSGNEVAIVFDLGQERDVSQVDVHVQGGGVAAVNFPSRSLAFLSAGGSVPTRSSGFGRPPVGFTWWQGNEPRIERVRSETDKDGVISFESGTPARARYVTLLMQVQGWLMVSEVRIQAGGMNVAPMSTYSFRPGPNPAFTAPYGDDGMRLTDGLITDSFTASKLTGWSGTAAPVITVDLGAVKAPRMVKLHFLRGGLHGIKAPSEVKVETSEDGQTWVPGGTAAHGGWVEDGNSLAAAPYQVDLPAGTKGRFIRASITRSGEWTMVSEFVVR